jgi:hypothetical protein
MKGMFPKEKQEVNDGVPVWVSQNNSNSFENWSTFPGQIGVVLL